MDEESDQFAAVSEETALDLKAETADASVLKIVVPNTQQQLPRKKNVATTTREILENKQGTGEEAITGHEWKHLIHEDHFIHRISDYKWSTVCILVTQFLAIGVGAIAPVVRVLSLQGFPISSNSGTLFKIRRLLARKLRIGTPTSQVTESSTHYGDLMETRDYLEHVDEEHMKDMLMKYLMHSLKDLMKKVNKPQNLIRLFEETKPSSTEEEFHRLEILCNEEVINWQASLSDPYSNYWLLPIFALTSIVVATSDDEEVEEIKIVLDSVSEALKYIKIVDEEYEQRVRVARKEKMEFKEEYSPLEKMLQELHVDRKWNDINLHTICGDNAAETLGNISMEATRSIAPDAVSMYNASEMLRGKLRQGESNTELRNRVKEIIVEIIAACLASLPEILLSTTMGSSVETRHEDMDRAFLIFSEVEDGVFTSIRERRFQELLDPKHMLEISAWGEALRKRTCSAPTPLANTSGGSSTSNAPTPLDNSHATDVDEEEDDDQEIVEITIS